jgi:ABC-2 type transport system ATP-binding protein
MPAIRTEALSRRFDGKLAVDELSIEVARGEVFGFLGPNGAGKTTTIRMLCALIAPSAGRAAVCGHDLAGAADEVRASVGILTESPGLYDRLSARANLELFGRLQGVRELDAQIGKYLGLLGLWERRDDLASELSKGMRQKLALARALLHEPPVLFLDEPTSALDPAAAHVVRDCIKELRGQGRTIFLCTHNLTDAEELCDRVALFRTRLLRVDTLAGLRDGMYGRAVRVRLRGAAAEQLERVRALPFVREASAAGGELRVALDDPEAQNPELVRALVAGGAQIVALQEEEHSLEQVYLDIMGPGVGEAAAGGQG